MSRRFELYLWDESRAIQRAPRTSWCSHLLRLVHWLGDVHGEPAELRFFRDAAGHEVDAIVLRKCKPGSRSR